MAFVLTFFVIDVYLTVLLFLSRGEEFVQAELGRFSNTMEVWGTPALYFVVMVGAMAWAARRFGARGLLQALLVGLISAAGWLSLECDLRPAANARTRGLPLLGAAGGLLDWSLRRISLAGREALYRVSRDLGTAESPDEMAAAIGRHLSGPDVEQVALWTVVSTAGNGAAVLELAGSWAPRGATGLDGRLDEARMPMLSELRRQTPRVVRRRELPPGERAAWEERNMRSALLVPVGAHREGPDGLLTVATRHRKFSRGKARAYLTIGPQVALALENLRLVDQARRSAVMGERRRLAHEIHDTLIQGFASIVMNLEAAEETPGADSARRHLDEARRTAREGMVEARRMVWALRPQELEDTPISEALTRLAGDWSEKNGVPADLTVTGSPSRLGPETEVTLLRAA